MKKDSGKKIVPLAVLGSVLRVLASMLAGILIALLAGGILFLNLRPDLSEWHTAGLDREFTTGSSAESFEDYLAIEEGLFRQLDEKVYARIRPEEKQVFNRYNKGSLSDPGRWPTNWNRSFELAGEQPVAGVLLLHGLSDSPYSLRRLGKRLFEGNVHVLGLRIPGHGTAPSGLVSIRWEDWAAAVELAMHHLRRQARGPANIYCRLFQRRCSCHPIRSVDAC